MNYRYLTKENIIQLHNEIIETTGGEKGILNEGNLLYVLDSVRYSGDLFARAGIIMRGIISGHPLVDGNKRAGFEATDIFLRMNGYYLEANVDEGVEFSLSIAKNELEIDSLTEWVERHAKKETKEDLKQFERLMDVSLEKNKELLKMLAEV